MPIGKARVFTLGSWAPSLRTMLNSTTAGCGCLVGVYQGWRVATVSVIDMSHPRCPHGHQEGDIVEDPSASAPAERH